MAPHCFLTRRTGVAGAELMALEAGTSGASTSSWAPAGALSFAHAGMPADEQAVIKALAAISTPLAARPRLLLTSHQAGEGVGHLAPALLHALEVHAVTPNIDRVSRACVFISSTSFSVCPASLVVTPNASPNSLCFLRLRFCAQVLPCHPIGLPALLADAGARGAEEALVSAVGEACRAAPSVLYLPHLPLWWEAASPALRTVLCALLRDLPPHLPVLLLCTAEVPMAELHEDCLSLFAHSDVVTVGAPAAAERRAFFEPLVLAAAQPPPPPVKAPCRQARPIAAAAVTEAAAPAGDRVAGDLGGGGDAEGQGREVEAVVVSALTSKELGEQQETALRQLRMFLRDLVTQLLRDRRWALFSTPVPDDEAEEYSTLVTHPMDLSTLLWRVDDGAYLSLREFVADVAKIPAAARAFHGYADADGQRVVSRAHALEDLVRVAVMQLDPALVRLPCSWASVALS